MTFPGGMALVQQVWEFDVLSELQGNGMIEAELLCHL